MTSPPHSFEPLTTAYADAVLAKDAARLASLYDAEVRVFDAWERWSYEGLAAWRTALEAWLGSLGEERVRVAFQEVRVSASDQAGALSAIVTYAAIDPSGETLHALHNRLTWVLARRGGGWSIVHEHTSAPIDFEHQKAILQRT